MAPAIRCPAHGPVSGPNCPYEGCTAPLEPDLGEIPAPATPCPVPGCGMPSPCPLHPSGAEHDAADREIAAYRAEAAAMPQHDDPLGSHADGLRFPWGLVTVSDTLVIGRDHPAECGAQIEDYTNVGREHAKVTLTSGQLFVEDLASLNGTTINGERITPFEPIPLNAGDIVGFAAHLRAVVASGTRK
ncbi:MAG: hypothetical protein QOC63_3406 [Mycobacterium sp.]|nr:hypothetical protein [Mycobacterium sp.]